MLKLFVIEKELFYTKVSHILEVCAHSGVASPICQEGQSKRPFPISAFPIFPFSWLFPDFPPLFPNFWQIFHCHGGTLPHFDNPPGGYATVCANHLQDIKCYHMNYNMTSQYDEENVEFGKPLSKKFLCYEGNVGLWRETVS